MAACVGLFEISGLGLKAEGHLGVCDLLSMLFSKMFDAFALLHTVRIVELDIKVNTWIPVTEEDCFYLGF